MVDERAAVLPEVAASIGLGLDGGLSALDALTAAFADRPFLLVVDNFEQVQAASPDIADLLARCPKVSVLATSRVPLKVRGERLVPLGPLELPGGHDRTSMEESAAVRLFVDRARAVRPAFSLDDPEDRDAVVELCLRLDGVPFPSSWPQLGVPCWPRVLACPDRHRPRPECGSIDLRARHGPCATPWPGVSSCRPSAERAAPGYRCS